MTFNDWVGTILIVVVFIIITMAYFYAFRPKNKTKYEKFGEIPLNED
jgi:cbb3-type cytochrome oxidase subunit 3